MEVKEFQQYCANTIKKIDQKYKINRNEQLAMSQLIEELGELAKEINLKKLRHKEPIKEDIEGEVADVVLQLIALISLYDIDLEESINKKITFLKERGYLEE